MDFFSAIQSAPGYGHIAPQSLAQFAPQSTACNKLDKILENETIEANALENSGVGQCNSSRLREQLTPAHKPNLDPIRQFEDLSIHEQLHRVQATKSLADLMKQNSALREQLQLTSNSKAEMERQNSVLREQLKGMKETVDALELSCKLSCTDADSRSINLQSQKWTQNLQSSSTSTHVMSASRVAPQSETLVQEKYSQDPHTVSKLQAELHVARNALTALNLTCKAAEDKILLQSQLHADKLRTMEVTHNTLQERCKMLSTSAEQHRVANILLEERHKSMTKDMEIMSKGCDFSKDKDIDHLKAMVCTKDRDIGQLQSLIKAKDADISSLQSIVATKDKNITLLQSIVNTKDSDTRVLSQSLKSDAEIHVISEGFAGIIRDKDAHITSLSSSIHSLNSKISNLNSEISTLHSNIDTKAKELKKITAECMNRLHTSVKAEAEVMRISDEFNAKIHKKEMEIAGLKSEVSIMNSEISSHKDTIKQITAECTEKSDKMRNKDKEISVLTSKIDSSTEESKRLQGKLVASQSLLRSHPINPCLNKKTKIVIQSSAEILGLAHDKGSTESMRECLGQVCNVLHDLHDQLDAHHRLSSVWLEQIMCI